MSRLLWLPQVLRAANLPVYEMPGWETRGSSNIDPQGCVVHHTATSRAARDEVVDKLLAVGRPDLAGPLSQLGLRRSGVWVVVASGRANHNGYAPIWGNDSIGVEAYNDGVGEPWPDAQMKSFVAGVAAICWHLGWGPERVKGHKETDPRRKIDPTFSMLAFRGSVAALLAAAPNPTPLVPSDPFTEEDPVWFVLHDSHPQTETSNVHWLVSPGTGTARVLKDPAPYLAVFEKKSVPFAGRVLNDLGYKIP